MLNFKEGLEEQLREINALIARTDRSLSKYRNLPDNRIMVSRSNGHDQYFWVDRNTGERKYINSGEKEKLRKAVQRDYEARINKKLKKAGKNLERFLRQYDIREIEKVYDRMANARKKLVEPLIEPEELFLKNWRSDPYDPMPVDNDTEFYTGSGVRVRSKSELLIAGLLEQNKIPYRYEYPLFLKKSGSVRPDFLCLNVRTRKEYIWEHFGMMDNIAYANKNIIKIRNYEQEGYFAGKNMIMSFETSQYPLSSVVIEKKIKEYLI